MKLTAFIPTYNGKAKLQRLFGCLRNQSDSNFDVHVLIDGSTDNTIELQAQFPEYQFHSYENQGRARIRNRALEICSEGLILFLDHDMLPEPELIAKHKQFHARNLGAIAVGNGFRNAANATDDFGKYLIASEQKWIARHPSQFRISKQDFVFTACNLSMPIELFRQLNGFNRDLRDGEDFELGMRALSCGIECWYDRDLAAWHDDWPTLEQYIHRNSEYLAGKKVLVKMNPEFEKYLRVDAGERSHNRFKQFLQGILGSAAMKNSMLFRMLPRNLRFTAYKSAIYQFSKAQ